MELFCSVLYLANLFKSIDSDDKRVDTFKSLTSYDSNLLTILLEAYDKKRELRFANELTPESIEKLREQISENRIRKDKDRINKALESAVTMLEIDREKQLIRTYLRDSHPLHMRRTLDQSYVRVQATQMILYPI